MTQPGAIEIDRASRRFRVYPQPVRTLKELLVARRRSRGTDVWALRNVSASIAPGEAVGLIGRNGSGKTTLLRLVAGIIKPTSGTVAVEGRVGSLLELGAGFHPEFTGRENVYLNGAILGLKREDIRRHMDEIVAFAELERFIDVPVRTYSSGMYMRLGFAVAAHLDVDVLLLDEVFAVGDEEFQRKCFGKIFEFKQRGGTIVFVSHDAAAVDRLCARAVLLRDGEVAFDGPTREAITQYHRLLAEEREPDERGAGLSEYGSGEARIAECRLRGAGRRGAKAVLAGRAAHRLTSASTRQRTYRRPGSRGSCATRPVSCWPRGARVPPTSGGAPARPSSASASTSRACRSADGRFRLRLELTDEAGGRLYHWLDDAARFVVYPSDGETGLVRIDGRWSADAEAAGRTDT